jgi:hypothetical protein
MRATIGTRLIGLALAAGLLTGVACSSRPSGASVSAGLSADVSLIQGAVSAGDRRTAIDLLHRLDSSVDGLAQIGSLAPARVAEIHAAVADVLDALRVSRLTRPTPTPTATPAVTASPPPHEHQPPGHGDEPPPDHGHGHDKPPKGDEKPPKD